MEDTSVTMPQPSPQAWKTANDTLTKQRTILIGKKNSIIEENPLPIPLPTALHPEQEPLPSHTPVRTRNQISIDMLKINLPLLEKSLDQKTSSLLTAEQKKQLGSFLEKSIGNRELNAMLFKKKNKTPGEQFLCSLSHYTKEVSSCSVSLRKVDAAIRQHNLKEVSSLYTLCEKQEKAIIKFCDEKKIEHNLQLKDFLPYSSQRLSKSRLQALKALQEKITDVENGPEELSLLIENTENLLGKILGYENLCSPSVYSAPLSPSDASTLAQFSKILTLTNNNAFFKQLDNEKVRSLFSEAEQADQSLKELESFFAILPNYAPGDILFDDDLYSNEYEKKKINFSKQEGLKGLILALKTFLKKGAWEVRPYLTGRLIHAAIASVNEGKPQCTEINEKFSSRSFNLRDGLIRRTYRPQFLKQASQLLQDKLKQEGIKDVDLYLQNLHAEMLKKYMHEHEKEFAKIENDVLRATKAFVLSAATHTPKPIEVTISFVFNKILYGTTKTFRNIKRFVKHDPEDVTKRMFCSEFVSKISKNVLAEMEQHLRNKYPSLKDSTPSTPPTPPPPLFSEIVPTSFANKAVHPGKLHELITHDDYFIKVSVPLAHRILFKHAP